MCRPHRTPIAPECQILPDECRLIATFVIEYADGNDHLRACDLHFANAYRLATERNEQAFLPVYIGTLQEVVAR